MGTGAIRLYPTITAGAAYTSNINSSASHNHTFYGRVSWWITPNVYTSLSGKLFTNQFVGVVPHFNNPLSARFSETPYGYLELGIGFKFGLPE